MSGADPTHDEHHAHKDSPVAASVVGLILVLVFGQAFALLNKGTWETAVIIAVVLLAAWTLVTIWVVDRRD
jgi:uncharacterized membrane protein YjjP (DUF1212 family)